MIYGNQTMWKICYFKTNNFRTLKTEILQRLGVSMSGLINMTIKQVIMQGGIPFDVKKPKMTTNMKDALKELDYIEKHIDKYKKNNNWDDLKKELLNGEDIQCCLFKPIWEKFKKTFKVGER